jgi:hypothetical protein
LQQDSSNRVAISEIIDAMQPEMSRSLGEQMTSEFLIMLANMKDCFDEYFLPLLQRFD